MGPPANRTCDKSECTYELPPNTTVRLQPAANTFSGPPALAPKFRGWRAPSGPPACTGGPTSFMCQFTFTRSVELRALFATDLQCQASPDC